MNSAAAPLLSHHHHPQPQQQQQQSQPQLQPQQYSAEHFPSGDGGSGMRPSRNDSLLAMRKHRSLDGGQFLSQFDGAPSTSNPYGNKASGRQPATVPPPTHYYSQPSSQQFYNNASTAAAASENGVSSSYYDYYDAASGVTIPAPNQHQKFLHYGANLPPYYADEMAYSAQPPFLDNNVTYDGSSYASHQRILSDSAGSYPQQQPQKQQSYTLSSSGGLGLPRFNPATNLAGGYGTGGNYRDANQQQQQSQPQSQHQQQDYEMLKRECVTMNQKLNYVMNSIRTFWSPELKKERQLRKEEALRISTLQYKLSQQAAEIQHVRNELEKREKDIGQLLSESDLGEMEAELRRLRAQVRSGAITANVTKGGSGGGVDAPRDFTNKTPSVHELQTARAKMERSELTLAEKSRDLAACEIRLKCTEEQNAELEKRVEILARSNAASDAQLKLMHDDLDVLRRKLETKNQQLESRDKTIKAYEREVDAAKSKIQQHAHTIQENERQVSQLTHRIDQLETLLRERDALADRLKQRLAQSPDTRAEAELHQRIENAERDKTALQSAIDELRRTSDLEKQSQLQAFQEENRQLRATIENLQKELSDRHILIVSQNEKISQLDAEMSARRGVTQSSAQQRFSTMNEPTMPAAAANSMPAASYTEITPAGSVGAKVGLTTTPSTTTTNRPYTSSAMSTMTTTIADSSAACQAEVDEARNEIGRLLSIVHHLEKEKSALVTRFNNLKMGGQTSGANDSADAFSSSSISGSGVDVNALLSKRLGRNTDAELVAQRMSPTSNEVSNSLTTTTMSAATTTTVAVKDENSALRLRIDALEEALRESVGITSERDRIVAEQKQLIQQLSNQVVELYKNCGNRDLQKLLQDTMKRAENAEKLLRDERIQAQRQITALRNELTMVVIREKEACIQLLQRPPDAMREKVEILTRQKETLKHRLLAISDNANATTTTTMTAGLAGAILPGTTSVQGTFSENPEMSAAGMQPTKALSAVDLNTFATAAGGFYAADSQPQQQQQQASFSGRQPHHYSVHRQPPSTAFYVEPPTLGAAAFNALHNNPSSRYGGAGAYGLSPINISVPPYGAAGSLGFSAPASLNYGRENNLDDDGIWA